MGSIKARSYFQKAPQLNAYRSHICCKQSSVADCTLLCGYYNIVAPGMSVTRNSWQMRQVQFIWKLREIHFWIKKMCWFYLFATYLLFLSTEGALSSCDCLDDHEQGIMNHKVWFVYSAGWMVNNNSYVRIRVWISDCYHQCVDFFISVKKHWSKIDI